MDEPNFKPLIQELGIDKLSEKDQKAVMEIALRTIEKRMSIRIASALTPEQLTQFEKAAKHGDQAEIERIYPNFGQDYQEEIDALKADMLAITPDKQPE